MAPRVLSLFSGIGGIDLGLERAGCRTVCQVEIDPFCVKVLERNFPDARRFTDVRSFDGTAWRGAVDVVAGGFPCQDISVAAVNSARDGLRGSRSGLWSAMRTIAAAQRPEWVVVENVAHGVKPAQAAHSAR